jgi:two-component system, chemotaxis family, sensor kinase Cph1
VTERALPLDLSICDREPIHIPGAIQPHGALLVARFPDLQVMQASQNASMYLGDRSLDEIVGARLEDLLDAAVCGAVRTAADVEPARGVACSASRGGRTICVRAHRSEGGLVIELERAHRDDGRGLDPGRLRALLGELQEVSQNVESMSEVIVRALRDALGFDRVMMYRFDDDGHGSVIAEALSPKLAPYLGLHFPASDIPQQARELYRVNWIRMIPDASYEPVPIVPARRPDTGGPLDLSFASLRSVSPVHLEYLRNFGAQAAMSLSVVCRGRLWGLITCNHRQPRYVPPEVRGDCELVAKLVSLQIAAAEELAHRRARDARATLVATLADAMQASDGDDPLAGLTARPGELLELVGAEGAVICTGDDCTPVGRTPPKEAIEPLLAWVRERPEGPIFETSELPRLHPEAVAYKEVGSGVLAMLMPEPERSGVLWFRPEVVQSVRWSGDPRKPVAAEAGHDRLHPRRSFREWREVVELTAPRWGAADVEIAEALRRRAVEIDLSRQVVRAERALRGREELLAVISHDLRSPLGVIRIGAESLRRAEAPLSERQHALVQRILRSSERMERLMDDLLEMGVIEAGRFSISPRREEPRALIEEAVAGLEPLAKARRQTLRAAVRDRRPVLADPDRLFQVLSNLVGNAIKYTPAGGSIEIWVEPAGGDIRFAVADTGPGIPPGEREAIFEPYRRGRGREAAGGVGLGLYIAKGIVEAHGGAIAADNRDEGGALVSFTLPAAA